VTSPDSSVPAVSPSPAGTEGTTIRSINCPFCGQRLRISFFIEVWSWDFVYATGGHVCPKAPVQPLPGDGEAT
jgi:hypothetical protein